MGYNALHPSHSSLLFGVIHLFERTLEPRGKTTQVAYLQPTLAMFNLFVKGLIGFLKFWIKVFSIILKSFSSFLTFVCLVMMIP